MSSHISNESSAMCGTVFIFRADIKYSDKEEALNK